jgi:ribokinase
VRNKEQGKQTRVVGLGQACVDYLGRVEQYPGEDEKVELLDLEIQCGGPASTAMVTLSRLGIKTSFVGSISDDPLGEEIAEGLRREQVDTRSLKITPGYTSQIAFIAITRGSGNRTIFWRRGSVPPLNPTDVNLSLFPEARILHLDGLMIEASLEATKQARKQGMTVVMDAGTFREGSRELASRVDVLIASERFTAFLVRGRDASPETQLRALKTICPGDVVVTRGVNGSMGLSNGRMITKPAFAVEAVDTTGAGDVYHGAYIYGILHAWPMDRCMTVASAAAALKCLEVGARKGIPDRKTLTDFLKQHAPHTAFE